MRRVLPRVSEKVEQAHIRELLIKVGAKPYTIGRPPRRDAVHKGTGQTPGIPDLVVHMPANGPPGLALCEAHQLWIEVKGKGGRLLPEQAAFQEFCERAGIAHVVGGLDAVLRYLSERGYVDPRGVAHYRRQGDGDGQ